MTQCETRITVDGVSVKCDRGDGHEDDHRFVVGPPPYPDIYVLPRR